jgi:hypothetical protein
MQVQDRKFVAIRVSLLALRSGFDFWGDVKGLTAKYAKKVRKGRKEDPTHWLTFGFP